MGDTFEARDIGVTTGTGETLVRGVSFELPERTVLAVIGPSGAGKSTLLRALAGVSPAGVGEIRYADRDLYAHYDELRHRIAVVPQDDVLHTQLTVADALAYAAQLRFPADTRAEDRQKRIDDVLAGLDLAKCAGQRISQLSGGERKRASVALELLTRPSLLFLDEPTSGLDPGMDRAMMQTLRTLADDPDEPRTVIVVTHNVANLGVCDRLLLLTKGGYVAYFGPPDGALEHFRCTDYAEIFLRLEQESGDEWARRFRSSEHGPGDPDPRFRRTLTRAPRQQPVLTQMAVLARRHLAVVLADRQYATFLAALPLVLSLLARAVPGNAGLSVSAALSNQDGLPTPTQLLLVLVLGASLMGAAMSVRELVKERAIYLRERAFGLSLPAYVASKLVVLTALVAAQATLFTVLSLIGRQPPDDSLVIPIPNLEILAAVLCTAIVSMAVGLALSAVIGTADQGMPLLVLMIMAQMVFSGGLFAIAGRPVLEQLAWVAPARWGFAMAAATTDLNSLYPQTTDPRWVSSAEVWATDAIVLAVITVVALLVILYRLRRLEPRRRRPGSRASRPEPRPRRESRRQARRQARHRSRHRSPPYREGHVVVTAVGAWPVVVRAAVDDDTGDATPGGVRSPGVEPVARGPERAPGDSPPPSASLPVGRWD